MLLMQGSCIDHRRCILIRTKYDHQVADHRGFLVFVKLDDLLLAELVKAKGLHVKPEQVRAIVDEFAETFEDPKEVVRWYYSQPQRLAEAEALALENNVVDWVLANATVTEKPIAFDELMGNAA